MTQDWKSEGSGPIEKTKQVESYLSNAGGLASTTFKFSLTWKQNEDHCVLEKTNDMTISVFMGVGKTKGNLLSFNLMKKGCLL